MFGVCPIDVDVHPHENGSISELFRLDPVLCHRSWDLSKQLQCCVSWWKCPPELDGFSVYSFHFTIFKKFCEPLICCFEASFDWRWCSSISPWQSTESGKRCTFAFDRLTALSCSKIVLIHGMVFHSIVDLPKRSSFWFEIDSFEISNTRLTSSKSVFLVVPRLFTL